MALCPLLPQAVPLQDVTLSLSLVHEWSWCAGRITCCLDSVYGWDELV